MNRIPFFDLHRQWPTVRADVEAAQAALYDSQGWILGAAVDDFEAALSEMLDVRHVIGVSSGTDALIMILRGLGLQPGDHVIVPAFTFFATAGAVWNCGLRPVFCDVDERTFNVTAQTVEAAWTDRTRAVIAVDLFGQMAPIPELTELCRNVGRTGGGGDGGQRQGGARPATLIEDAAQSLGATRAGVPAGAAAHVTAHSFYPTKNLGAFGDAGAVTTHDDQLAERIRKLRVHGGRQMYEHEMVGTNARLDAMQAAILMAKLPRLAEWVAARRAHASVYHERLEGVVGMHLPLSGESPAHPQESPGGRVEHAYNQFTLRSPRRTELRAHLAAQGIGSAVYYPSPLHLQPCFASLGYHEGDFPVAERLCREVVSLPIFPELESAEVERVSDQVSRFFTGG
jgi:dTDP-4-amino-4,6-dideoxygalactose transaminase